MSDPTPPPEPPIDPWIVERLLHVPAQPKDQDEQNLAVLFAALRAPAEPTELDRQGQYVAAFTAARTEWGESSTGRRHRFGKLLSVKAAVAAAVLVTVSTGAAAAYTGSLPRPLQEMAHSTIGAPAPDAIRPSASGPGNPAVPGPDPGATSAPSPSSVAADVSSSDRSLCSAYANGDLTPSSTDYRSLASAAGGAARIPSFCSTVRSARPADPLSGPDAGAPSQAPSSSLTETPAPAPAETDIPTSTPTEEPSAEDAGKPVGKPAKKPHPKSTGKSVGKPNRQSVADPEIVLPMGPASADTLASASP